jgi:hypothetical protein
MRYTGGMRVLKTLFFSLFWLVLIAGIGFLITREVLLQLALSQLTSDAKQLQGIARNTGVYIQDCQAKGSNPLDGSIIESIQLRFTSPNEYQIEVICSQYSIDPLIVEKQTLPYFVTKVPGTSGLTWRFEPTAVSLQLWGRTRSLGISEEKVEPGLTPAEVGTAFAPITSCLGLGYTCCQNETTIGEGPTVSTVTDCPRTCHTSCNSRPVILSVSSQPFIDQATRTVTIPRGSEVSIGYVVDHQGLEGVVTTVDYGDGQQDQFTEVSGFAPHTYQCATGGCRYAVQVSATSADGVVSADTPITKVTVIVQ